ncbi:MmyB family transcriptional regulator, partial [Streptomyces acidiscabies]|uniref:MmyB family transcriptional regulator n=1 Tax=Streptomyces acidiscabies TaxID=42234 RepID=UPI00403AF858
MTSTAVPACACSAAVLGNGTPALRRLLDAHLDTPAFVVNRTLDILAANALTRALYSPFERL